MSATDFVKRVTAAWLLVLAAIAVARIQFALGQAISTSIILFLNCELSRFIETGV